MSWTLRHNERPWTANSARAASHWSKNADRTKKWRTAFQLLALEQQIPPLGPSRIIVTPYLQRGPIQDVGACAPAAKAAIDGLVDAGLWPDDTPTHVTEIVYRAPILGQGNALVIEIQSVIQANGPLTWITRAA